MGTVPPDCNQNIIYLMTDPDYSKSKPDAFFFADRIDSKVTSPSSVADATF
jgi:hypothetical protein